MKRERQIEEMARLEGLIDLGKIPEKGDIRTKTILVGTIEAEIDPDLPADDQPWREVSNYLEDLNATRRVLCKLDEDNYERAWACLRDIVGLSIDMPKAEAAQVTEAILKATGKWEGE